MPTPEQINAIQLYCTEVWAKGNLDVIDEIFTPDCVRHGPAFEEDAFRGTKGQKDLVTAYRTAMSDLQVPAADIVGEGDIVLTRWTATGTNDGQILGAAPTGKSMEVFGFWMHRFEGNRIAEEWATWDTHGFLQQLGLSQHT